MSKKKIKHKIGTFALEADGFSVHTLELTAKLSGKKFNTIKSYLYDQIPKNIYQDTARSGSSCYYVCSQYQTHGIRLMLVKNRHEEFEGCFLRLIVNPRKLIEPDCSYLGILPPKKESIEKFSIAFFRLFVHTPIPSAVNDYKLTRIDCCTNIRCNRKKLFREMVRVLRKLPTPSKYNRIYYSHANKKKANKYNKHYIRFACGSQELVIYDKTYQAAENNLVIDYDAMPDGIIRFEVKQLNGYIHRVEKKAKYSTTEEILWHFVKHSEEILVSAFSKCFADTPFFHIEELTAIIQASRFCQEKKDAMVALVLQLQRVQSVDKALANLQKKNIDTEKLLNSFKRLGINPIPLRQNFSAESLPSPITLLRSVSKQDVLVKYQEIKYS